MPIKYQGTHRVWVRSGGVWVALTEADATNTIYDVLGGASNQAWKVYRRGTYNPISGVQNWHHVLTTNKNSPTTSPANPVLTKIFQGINNWNARIDWDNASGESWDVELNLTNFQDSAYNQFFLYTNTGGPNDSHTFFTVGLTGQRINVSLTYTDGFFPGVSSFSNDVIL